MLDVQRRVDVDAGGEQLLDVLVALGMAAARRVGVGQLVDQHQARPAREDGVEVHLLERAALVVDAARRGMTSSPSSSASVSARPCVSTTPIDDIDALAALAPAAVVSIS